MEGASSGASFIVRGLVALRDTLSKAKLPPKLRRGNARRRCGLCVHYGTRECMKYGWPVRETELCDSFDPKEKS